MTRARENADLPVAMTESGGKVGVGSAPATAATLEAHGATVFGTGTTMPQIGAMAVYEGSVSQNYTGGAPLPSSTLNIINGDGRADISFVSQRSDASTNTQNVARIEADGSAGWNSKLNFYLSGNWGDPANLAMSLDNGRVTMPNQPVYSASDSRALSAGTSHLNSSNFYNHVYVNVGNHMNTSTGNFTCPVAGIYRIYFRATHNNSGCNVRLQKNGTTINEAYSDAPGSTYSVSSEAVVSCAANDTLRIQFHSINIVGGHQHKQVTFQLLS